jgi:uncharacterized protein YprB with RNaseH-like and TPR domain
VAKELEFVAFDIETTGFDVTDGVTAVGFALPLGCRVFVQTGGRESTDLEATVRDRSDQHVVISTYESEQELLVAISTFVADRLREEDKLLVAYNGERWKSGFDLPFLRTRYAAVGVEWPFSELPYADLMPIFNHRFNTTVDGEDHADLDGVYDVLLDGDLGTFDPFEDSSEAVDAFEDGAFGDLVLHLVSDVLQTDALGELAQQYCSKSDFQLKSLTPTIHD